VSVARAPLSGAPVTDPPLYIPLLVLCQPYPPVYTTDGSVSSIRVVVVVPDVVLVGVVELGDALVLVEGVEVLVVVLVIGVLLVVVLVVGVLLVVDGVGGDAGVLPDVAVLAETEADAPVKSTMNVSIRVEQPNAVSAPSVPSQ
jgi:hypothetical protein